MDMYESIGAVVGLLYLAIIILIFASAWKIFEKAGKPGWAAIIPIYNIIVFLEIVNKPIWWIILILIPFVGFVIMIILSHRLSIAFGQGVGFTIGLILLGIVFVPMLAFGDYKYQGAPA